MEPPSRSEDSHAPILLWTGGIVTVLAGLVLLGWHLRVDALLHVAPRLPVMRHNTALALTLAGVSLVARHAHRRHVAVGCASVVAAIGGLTLVQYLAGIDLGIDELLVKDYLARATDVAARTVFPGRMAPASALCIFVLGLACMLVGRSRPATLVAGGLAVLCAAFASASLLAFVAGVGHVSRHWLYAGMAVHTAALLVVAAVGLFAWAIPRTDRKFPHFVALGTGLAGLIFTIMIWQGLQAAEVDGLRRMVANQGSAIREELLRTLGSNAGALRRMAKRWDMRGGTPRVEWEEDAREYIATLPGLESLAWIDAEGTPRWVAPRSDPSGLRRPNPVLDHAYAAVASGTNYQRDVAYSKAFELPDGDSGFLIVAALRPANRPQGALVAVLRTRPFLQTLLRAQEGAGILVTLIQDGTLVYAEPKASRTSAAVTETVNLEHTQWTLELRPAPALMSASRSHLPATALWGGSLLSLLLALTLDRGLTAGQQARSLARQRAELESSEAKYRSLVESLTEGMIVAQDGRCVFANPTLASMLGYAVDEMVGLTFADYIGPDQVELATARFRARVSPAGDTRVDLPDNYETQFRHKDGHLIWVNLRPHLTEFEGRPAVQTVVRNIDARKAAEAALRFIQQRMELVARGSVDGIWDWNVATGEEYLSDRWYELLGYEPGELPARVETWSGLLHPDDRDMVLAALQRHLVQRNPYDIECRMRTKSGAYRWYRCAGQALWSAAGEPLRMAGSISDIESRKQTELARALSEARFRAAMQNAPIGMALVSPEGRWLQVNSAVCEIVGYTPAELMRLTFQDITHPEDLGEDLALVGDMLAGRIATYSMDKRYIRKDGSDIWVRLSVSLARDLHGAPEFFISQIENIDERMRQEQRIREALDEKEMLLREVYHRVKNNLQVIRNLLNLQSRSLPEGDSRRAMQETAARVRAMALVHEKLYQSGNLASIAMQDFAGDLIAQIGESTGVDDDRIGIQTEIAELHVGLDTAIPLGLLMNELVSNCVKHGFPNGRHGRIVVRLLARDDGAELVVEDDGVGLPEGFDPTQTRSMGLRLATSLARQLGGTLQHQSQPDLGSRFSVVIDSLAESVEAAASRMSVAERSLYGTRRLA